MAITIELRGRDADRPRLPELFAAVSRSADPAFDVFIPPGYLTPRRTLELGPAARGEDAAAPTRHDSSDDEVLVLELADGDLLVTSAARLRDSLRQTQPELVAADGTLRLEALHVPGEPTRDAAAVIGLISRVFGFGVGQQPDEILLDAARQFGIDQALLGVSWLGTKALMWAIEKRLPRGPGLYAWTGGELAERPLAALDARIAQDPAHQPILVFLHGTGSSTAGSFGDLRHAGRAWWAALEQRYPGGIYGFEHRTLSESPIDNALALLALLPPGVHLSLVTHSRGGLVGDLLCVGDIEAAIAGYRHDLPGTGDADPNEAQRVLHELDDAHAEQRGRLQQLSQALRDKQPVLQRYVRVAAPAAGTRLASGNFDLFLSGLLSLIGKVPGLFGSPYYAAFKRVVLEIAKNRTNARLVPGIEAMLPDAPLARLLRDAPVREGLAMAVIAGDIEGGDALLRRLGVLLVDFVFFDQVDNDLVVDTPAMLAGIAPRAAARVRFDRGGDVSHFRYFENADTRDALNDWLLADDLAGVEAFRALPGPDDYAQALAEAAATRDVGAEERPLVIVLPGIMGSHLAAAGDRIWFDPLDLARGRLDRIAWGRPQVAAQALFALVYGGLCRHLAASHRVEPFAYDWRQPLDQLADQLADLLRARLAVSAQPVRLLAHSLGGLVVRACMHRHAALMDELMARPGARLVMLGTPNQGAYSMVANLIGKGGTLRTLARLDLEHDLQQVLDIVAGFRGALALLPKPGFREQFQGQDDGGADGWEFQRAPTWATLATQVRDAWFGDGKVARPLQEALDAGSWLWQQDGAGAPALPERHAAKSVYVFGVGANTPCGLREVGGRLKLVGTPHGDGTVSWQSGRIGGIGQYYYLPAEHGDLPSTAEHFPALGELLDAGRTTRLATTPPAVRAVEQPVPVTFDAGPPVLEDDETLLRRIVGAAPRRSAGAARRAQRRLEVAVRAMDLRFITQPILVGQYDQDPIAGPQALIDRELLGGALSERHRLNMYPGALGSATAVLRVAQARPDGSVVLDGAIVTGLGGYDRPLTLAHLTEAVRTGVLRTLLQTLDMLGTAERELPLAALLIGYNSSANLSIEASVEALVRGTMEANARFRETTGAAIRIQRLDIVELFADTAISAAYALRSLTQRLQPDAARLGTQLVGAVELIHHPSCCQRLYDGGGGAYWPRLIVTDAGRPEGEEPAAPAEAPLLPGLARRALLPDRLRFVYVGRRARAETLVQQRQPGLVEKLLRGQIQNKVWQEDFGRMLFQLMVPHDFKDAARQLDRVVLVVDSFTANLPWELMLGDEPGRAEGERLPLSLRTAMVRQLSSSSYRRQVRQSVGEHALVVGNPSLDGFVEAFPGPNGQPRPQPEPLAAAEEEAGAVQGVLGSLGYEVKALIGADRPATDVFAALYERAWRLVHISAHGVFDLRHADGRDRSGVLLSDGMLITAAEFEAMEVVPELVFLNCCHLGKLDSTPLRDGNKLAASVARELIEVGVRCVVVAGWAVSDHGARLFGETFYRGLIGTGLAFGDAVHQARRAVWEADPSDITWGAFQAYGDPGWRASTRPDAAPVTADGGDRHFVSPDELLDALARLRSDVARRARGLKERDRRAFVAQVHTLLRERARPGWLTQPALQAALGATWRDLGEFALARTAYLAAVRADDRSGRVSIRDMEQLANVEARLGEMVGDAGLVRQALVRLDALTHLTAEQPVDGAQAARRNAERAALLGSAYKRFAGIQARALLAAPPAAPAAALAELRKALGESRQAYAEAGEAGGDPYLLLNRLALDALLPGARDVKARRAAVELARRCATMADERFVQSGSVWDALMQPEARLVEQLLEGTLALEGAAGDAALALLQQAYAAALGRVVVRPAEIDSTLSQLELLSRFADALSLGDPPAAAAARRTLARRLLQLVQFIQPGRARRTDRPADAATAPAAGMVKKTTATKAPAKKATGTKVTGTKAPAKKTGRRRAP